jgi:hypothetical protein
LDADNGIGPGETIAPGYTIDQAVDQISNDCHVLQNILEPPSYLLSAIDDFIARSDLSEPFKRYLTYKTPFTVHYDLHNLFGEVIGETRKKDFTLLELVMGLHKREQELHEKIRLDWSSGYTPGFRGAIDGASIWEEYKVAHNKFISEPRYFDLWKLKIELEIKLLVEDFAGGEQASELGRRIAREYLNGNIRVQPLSIQKGKFSNPIEVSNAVFLSSGTGGEGLFVFLGANGKVIESPVEIFKEGGKSIEMFPELREALLKRIPLQELLAFGDTDFKYSQGRFVWSLNNIEMFKNYKWSYKPILFGLQPGHNYCEGTNDIFKCMFDTVVDKAKSDMDAMTFTATERAIDIALDMLAETLKYSGYGVALTGAAAAAFLLGASSSVTQYLRGLISDNPSEASRHKSNAVVGMIGQVVGKYIGQLLGKAISRAAQTRIAQRIIERLRPTGPTPGTAIYQASKNVHATSPVANQVNKIERWIAPRVRDLVNIQDKVNRKFTNSLVVERLKSLGKGPHVAQRLMNRSRVLYFAGSRQGYVYRGFAMRGDMRRPEDVFIKGFDSNSGQASGYYNSNGMGAFHHGGKQGGWTYLIDARGLDGEDLLRNINWKAGAGSQLGSNPYRIAYTDKIPGSNVVGAYDSTG